jgi:hypothetical protein
LQRYTSDMFPKPFSLGCEWSWPWKISSARAFLKCERSYLECPRTIELRATRQQDLITEKWQLLTYWRQNNASAELLWWAGSTFVQSNSITITVRWRLLLFIEARQSRDWATHFCMGGPHKKATIQRLKEISNSSKVLQLVEFSVGNTKQFGGWIVSRVEDVQFTLLFWHRVFHDFI